MKKISVLFMSVLAMSLTLTSCDKDDSDSASLEGKWNFSKAGAIVSGQEILTDYSGNETGCSKDYINLTSAGVFTNVDYDSTDNPCEVFTTLGTFTRSGNNVTVTVDGIEDTVEILSLTSSELKIKGENDYITLFTRG